jgi:hypothetical protein
MSDRDDLKAEATDLEIEFKGNISSVKLRALVAEAKGEPPPVEETAPASPAMKPETEIEELEAGMAEGLTPARKIAKLRFDAKRQRIAAARGRAFKTQIVTLTNKDNRENDVMTTAFLGFENQHFGLSKLVPLDIPVQLEYALIRIAESTMMTLHKDEIVAGRRTGNKIPVRTKKFAISYARQ